MTNEQLACLLQQVSARLRRALYPGDVVDVAADLEEQAALLTGQVFMADRSRSDGWPAFNISQEDAEK